MLINGLVVTLDSDPDLAAAVVRSVVEHPRLSCGSQRDGRLPVVAETDSAPDAHAVFRWLQGLAGVTAVRLVYTYEDLPKPACLADPV